MKASSSDSDQPESSGRLVLSSLVFAVFSLEPCYLVTSLLLVEIAATFGVPVGVAGQLRTASFIVSVLSALVVSLLSIRFRHKSLLLAGLLLVSLSALGCGIAPSFELMLGAYLLTGLGAFIVGPMANTLIAEHFPVEKRASAIGWLMAGSASTYFVGPPIVGIIGGFGGWRITFLAYALPLVLVGLVFAFYSLPGKQSHSPLEQGSYAKSLGQVLIHRSAVSCLIGNGLAMASFQLILTYLAAFLVQQFHFSVSLVSMAFLVGSAVYITGSVLAGRVVGKLGRKASTVVSAFLAGVFFVMMYSMSSLYLALALSWFGCFFAGIRVTAATSLTLEQVPEYRATAMSLNAACGGAGSALGTGVGGMVLLLFGYATLGVVLGAMSIAAAFIVQFLARDPTARALNEKTASEHKP